MWIGIVDLSDKFPEIFDFLIDDFKNNKIFWDEFYY